MFVVSSERTMASAKPKFREPEKVRTIEEIRAEKRVEAAEAYKRQREADSFVIGLRRDLDIERARSRALEYEVSKRDALIRELEKEKRWISGKYLTFKTVEQRICRAFGLRPAELYEETRTPRLVLARQALMYWARRMTIRSFPEIGRLMGGRDHTTVLHGATVYPEKRAAMGRTLRAVR